MSSLSTPLDKEIIPGLFIGSWESTEDLKYSNITSIVSILGDPMERWKLPQFTDFIQPDHHLFIQCNDYGTSNLLMHMSTVCDFIDNHLPSNGALSNVLIHCWMGISRSAAMLIAYLMRKLGKGRDETLALVRDKWPRANPNPGFMRQLKVWEEVRFELWESEGEEVRVEKKEYREFLEDLKAWEKVMKKTPRERARSVGDGRDKRRGKEGKEAGSVEI